jgi:hypothetical protein
MEYEGVLEHAGEHGLAEIEGDEGEGCVCGEDHKDEEREGKKDKLEDVGTEKKEKARRRRGEGKKGSIHGQIEGQEVKAGE